MGIVAITWNFPYAIYKTGSKINLNTMKKNLPISNDSIIKVKTISLNDSLQEEFKYETEINALRLIVMAESREDTAKTKGEDWTRGAIPFFGSQLLEKAQAKKPFEELEPDLYNLAMCAWLVDSLFYGITAEEFIKSHLIFTLIPGGAVQYDRKTMRDIM